MLQATFIISRQSALLEQPSKGPLDQPTFRQDFKSADLVAASHDVQMQLATGAQGFDPRHQGTGVATISPDFGQPLIPTAKPTPPQAPRRPRRRLVSRRAREQQ